jgi:hypothetical protein
VFRCSVKSTGYPLYSSVSPSLPLPCVTVSHHISQLESATGTGCRLKCDGTRAETRSRLSAKRTSPFKNRRGGWGVGRALQFSRLLRSRGVRISGSNAGYTMFRGSVKCTGYPLYSAVSPSLPHPRVTVCHHISSGLYLYPPLWVFVACSRLIFTFNAIG